MKKSSQITVPYRVVDKALSLFHHTSEETKRSDEIVPLSLTLFSPNADDTDEQRSSFLYRTLMSKKEEMLRKKKMNRFHVATRGIESDLYRRHYTDLSKTMSAQLVIQNDTPYTLKFVRADLGDSCMCTRRDRRYPKPWPPEIRFVLPLWRTLVRFLP